MESIWAAAPAAEAAGIAAEEVRLIAALRRGDEAAFAALIERHHTAMLGVARLFVAERAVAEEVVQEAWLGVLEGLDRFAGRSSLKTWIFRILTNIAQTRGRREARCLPFSALVPLDLGSSVPAVDPYRFLSADDPRQPGHWASPPRSWGKAPQARLETKETLARLETAIAALPRAQRAVVTLRDVQGWSASEVCALLEISEANQRVLLHRARATLRQALEGYLAEA